MYARLYILTCYQQTNVETDVAFREPSSRVRVGQKWLKLWQGLTVPSFPASGAKLERLAALSGGNGYESTRPYYLHLRSLPYLDPTL